MIVSQVNVSGKDVVYREAAAEGYIRLRKETIELIQHGKIEKGDPLTVSKVAGILAAKQTHLVLPLCHPLQLEYVDIAAWIDEENSRVVVRSTVVSHAKTGVEMEALFSVTAALLNVWDMVKQYEKNDQGQYPHTAIESIRVVLKKKEG